MGQGLQTTYTQMMADSLGIALDKIDVVQGDTDLATGFGSVGSRSLFVGGTAVAVSSNDLINKAREKASNLLEASVEDIEYRDGWLTVVGTDRRISLFEIARKESGASSASTAKARSTDRAGRTAAISAKSRSIPRPASAAWCATPRSMTSASPSIRCW